jgi:hypothetical protein
MRLRCGDVFLRLRLPRPKKSIIDGTPGDGVTDG